MVIKELLQSNNIEDIKVAMSAMNEEDEAEVVEFYWMLNIIWFGDDTGFDDILDNEVLSQIKNPNWRTIDKEMLNILTVGDLV